MTSAMNRCRISLQVSGMSRRCSTTYVRTHVVANLVRIPLRPPQQVLHADRCLLVGPFGDGPAALARQVRQQPEYQAPDAASGSGAGEPARDAAHQVLERLLPAGRVYAVTCGHRMIVCLHTPMVNDGHIHVSTGPDELDLQDVRPSGNTRTPPVIPV